VKITLKLVAILALASLWFTITRNQSSLDSLKLPSPESVFLVIYDNYQQIFSYTLNTIFRVLIGYFSGCALGIVAACLMLWNKYISAILDTYIELLRPVPPISLTPFFIFWFGIGNSGQFVLISMVSFLVFAVALFESGKAFEPRFLRAARSLGAGRRDIILRIVLPGSMVQLGAAARIAAAGAISVTIAAEYLGAQGGLGYMIRNARVSLQTDSILVAIIILGFISFLFDRFIRITFRKLTEWMPKDETSF